MVFGIAVGDANGVLVALRDIVATEGKAGRVEMMEALFDAFLGTDSQSQLAKQQITPIGMDCIECPAKLKAIEHLRSDPGTQQQIEGFVGKKLGSERQRSIGKPQAIEAHPGYSFARGDRFLLIRHEARIDHACQA
jgi:hypothetical protein